jgi:AcrR family transcriptional regulator
MGRKVKIANKRELIIEAASKLFGKFGFEKTTIEQIANEIDVGKGTIYTEFETKEEIMLAVSMVFMHDVNIKMRKLADKAKDHYLDTLKELLVENILIYYDYAKINFYASDLLSFSKSGIKNKQEIRLLFGVLNQIITELLEKAAHKQEIPPSEDYLAVAKTIRSALTGFYPPHVLRMEDRKELEKEVRDLLSILIAGLTVRR